MREAKVCEEALKDRLLIYSAFRMKQNCLECQEIMVWEC